MVVRVLKFEGESFYFFFFPQCNGRNLREKLLLYFSVFPEVQWWEFEGESSNLFFYRSAAVGNFYTGCVNSLELGRYYKTSLCFSGHCRHLFKF